MTYTPLDILILLLAAFLLGACVTSLLWWLADRKTRRDIIADAEARRQAIIAAKYAGCNAARLAMSARGFR